ncbi:MAG: cupin domain-containing protein [Burkholderiales bacterium]|nr:cupin domain-containing protein [Burkholderiales bacterium]
MDPRVRRVVTGHDDEGKSIVVSDGFATSVKTVEFWPGLVSTDIWKSTGSPVVLRKDEPDPTLGPRTLHQPQGTIMRISIVPPETDAIRNLDPQQAREVFRGVGNAAASTMAHGSRHPLMHRTETLDYAVVLEGEITLVLDESEVNLRQGDVVIQRGTNHAWSNRSGKPARMLYILMDGRFDTVLSAALGVTHPA